MSEFNFQAPQVLSQGHRTDRFDCGNKSLNEFLQLYAATNAKGGSSLTFVVSDAEQSVVGYYTLAATSVEHEDAPDRVRKGQPRYAIPAILMARFAVDRNQQGRGLGRALFRDALLRSLNITDELGAHAFVVDAKDAHAVRFYENFGMMKPPQQAEESPGPVRLYLLFKDVKKILKEEE